MTQLKIYVACPFVQYERARLLMDDLREAGHSITFDWTRTEDFDAEGRPTVSDAQLSDMSASAYATHMQRAVESADLIVVIVDSPLCGALIELGMAIAFGVEAIVIDPWRETLFWRHPSVERVSDEDEVRARLIAAR